MKQIDGKAWASAWSTAVGAKVAKRRGELGLSAQALSDACTELGYPIARNTIVNIETGRKEAIVVQEISILATALGAPPVWLLFPELAATEFDALPSATTTSWWATKWFTGETHLYHALAAPHPSGTKIEILASPHRTDDFDGTALTQMQLLRQHEYLAWNFFTAQERAHDAWVRAGEKRTPEVTRLESREDEIIADLAQLRRHMLDADIVLPHVIDPEIGPEIAALTTEVLLKGQADG